MIYKKADISDLQEIYKLIHNTIYKSYKSVYKDYEVEFFSDLHNVEAVEEDILKGNVYVLLDNNKIMATATVDKNHITRVFVKKDFLRQGYGSKIMDIVEKEIFKSYDEIILDSSIVAKLFYESRGYVDIFKGKVNLKNGEILEYDIMKKFDVGEI